MFKPIAALLLSITLFAVMNVCLGQSNFWEPTGGPQSARIKCLAIKPPDTVFAGTRHGVLRSTDNGESWQECGLSKSAVNALVVTPNGHIFAGTDSASICRSRDNGLSWESVNTGLPVAPVISLATHSSGELVTGTEDFLYDVYRSTNDGDSWTLVAAPQNPCIVAINDSGHIFLGRMWGLGGSIGRSTDHGASWVWLGPPDLPGITRLAVNSLGHILAGTKTRGFFRSTDNGLSWDSSSSGLNSLPDGYLVPPFLVEDLLVAPGDTLYVATSLNGVLRSTDNGRTWLPSGLSKPVKALAASPSGTLFAGGASLYRSSNRGDHWVKLNVPGRRNIEGTFLAVNSGDTLYAGSWGDGLFTSTDHGESWSELIAYHDDYNLGGVAVNTRGDIFVPLALGLSAQCYRSTDYGKHWTALPIRLWYFSPVFTNSGYIFVIQTAFLGTYAVHRSTDNGDSWVPVFNDDCRAIAITSRGYLFVATMDSGIYRSTDAGAQWTPCDSAARDIEHLAAGLHGEIYAASDYRDSLRNIYSSTDDGDSWTLLYTVPTQITGLAADRAGSLFVATDTMGVYRNGVPINSGLPTFGIGSLALDSRGYLFAGTAARDGKAPSGVYRSVQPTTAVGEEMGEVPMAFALEQCFPNPFNPGTTIGYTVGGTRGLGSALRGVEGLGASNVKLTIYNLLGQVVAVLVNEQQAPGRYTIRFDGSRLATGVYLYRLQAGGFVETKRMLLLK